jgi:hypothetical protein
MMMRPAVRKFALTAHVVLSVGWLGAVVAFLSLAVTGLSSADAQLVRAAYIASKTMTWSVIVPLSFAALLTGLVQSVGTQWGLFRHYWVVAKLVIAIFATALLLLHTRPIDQVAAAAAERALSFTDLRDVRLQLVWDAVAAMVALLTATVLSIYKPAGLLPEGRLRGPALIALAVLAMLFVLRHVMGGGHGSH